MAETGRGIAVFELPKDRATSLRCAACMDRTCEAIGTVPGVLRVDCDTSQSQVRVEYEPDVITGEQIERRMADLDLELSQTLVHRAWRVSGLD